MFCGAAIVVATGVRAQETRPGIVAPGDLAVTGFSGILPPPANPPLPAGVNALDETFINGEGASLKVFDVRNPGSPPEGQVIAAPVKFQAFARDMGQVFGLALDDADPPNIYAAATSVHGLQIVIPDADGDGRPERVKLGQPGAQWMEGQFGLARGGGPGTVWKIDGATGAISVFANIASGGVPNSGPGLGNIAYDRKHKQLYISDLDTGLIHRLNMSGSDLGTFDHGTQGRPTGGLQAVPMDPADRLDITKPKFDAEDSDSWGLADPARRVWGLAYHGDRLYYAVAEGPQIWSVGINQDGSFAADPRWELDIDPEPKDHPISDIAFTAGGVMIVAQRGGITSSYDYSEYHAPRKNRVLRFTLESPDNPDTPSRWAEPPDEYAIGFPATHQNSAGGVAIGYGYRRNSDGSYRFGACEGTLWTTGDALRNNAVYREQLTPGGAFIVHGLQGNALELDEPESAPPWKSYFVDYDGKFDDPQASGLVGDVEIAHDCRRRQAMDLRILKRAQPERCLAGNRCTFVIEIENVGSLAYSGPLEVWEDADGGAKLVGHGPAPNWECRQFVPGRFLCTHALMTLAPGEKTSFEVTIELPGWWTGPAYRNCANLRQPGSGEDDRTYNNRSCDYVPVCEPGSPYCKPDLALEKFAIFGNCFFGECLYAIRITNVGAADYIGPLSVHDVVEHPAASLLDWGPQPAWTVAAGPVAGSYEFSHPAPVTLSPGEFREFTVFIQQPPIGLGPDLVRNCSYIHWEGRPRDFNPFNEYDCADVSVFSPGHPAARPKLAIDKTAQPTCTLLLDWVCSYEVTITNIGGAPYLGEIVVTDVTTADSAGPGNFHEFLVPPPPPWGACMPGGGVGPQTCTHPAMAGGLLPGDSVHKFVTFTVPAATPKPAFLKNCATIKHDNDGDGVAEEIKDCASALICDPGLDCPNDVAIEKSADGDTCWPGFPCKFHVKITNLSNANHPAGLVIHDIPNPDAGALSLPGVLPAFFNCNPAGPNHDCTLHVGMLSNTTFNIPFEFVVPNDYPWTTFKNCAKIDPSANNVVGFNDEGCDTAFIPGPDLAPFGGTECQRGVPCKLDVTVDNKGKRPFRGAAGLKGILSPPVQITSISSQTAGFACSVTGNGAYRCDGGKLEIAPGAAAKLQLTILVPESFPGTRITHAKDMVWPDQKVKDRNPQNDHHESIITIAAPKAPPPTCTGGTVVRNQCVCPKGWERERDQRRPNAYRCVEPPPQVTCTDGRVVDNACICPPGWDRDRIRRNVYRCVAPTPTPTCIGGRVVDNTCVCPSGWDRDRIGRNAYRCQQPPRLVTSCQNGRVVNNVCICPRGWARLQTRPNRFSCIEPPPRTTCVNGDVRNGQCICPKGWERSQTGRNAWTCSRPPPPTPPRVTCVDGDIRNGRCICPKGWSRSQTGKTAWRCNPPRQSTPTPSLPKPIIVCSGGSISNGRCICPRGWTRRQTGKTAWRCESPKPSQTLRPSKPNTSAPGVKTTPTLRNLQLR